MHWSWLLFFLKLKASFYVPELGAQVFKGISIKQALALLDWAPGSRGIGWNSQGSLLNSWCSCLGDLSRTWLGPEKADQNLAERCFVLKSEDSQILTLPLPPPIIASFRGFENSGKMENPQSTNSEFSLCLRYTHICPRTSPLWIFHTNSVHSFL